MNTGKIAFIMLRKRWKFVITIIFTMVISASIAILTVILADSFYMQKKSLAFQNYGSFINRFYELDQKTCEKLHRHSGLQTGFFELYGNATVESADLTIGHVDETYQTLTNMYLEEGRWPENRQEVAMERFAAELFGVSGVDEWITVSMGKKDWTVKVTGIVRNYSSRLMLITPIQKGINNYPAIFCMENSVLKPWEKPVSQSALITFSNPDAMSWNQAITYQKMEQLLIKKEIPVSNSYTNDLLYVKGLKYCGEIIICTWVFSVIVSAAAILCCLRLFAVFYKDYDKKSAVIRVLGGQKKIMMQVLFWQLLFLLGTSLILCLVEILILRYLIPGVFMEGYWKESYLLIFLVWFVLFGIIVESWLFFVLKQSFQGPIRKVFTGYEQGIHSGKYLKRNYNLIRGLRSPDKAACILFVLLFLISSFALSNIYLAEIDDGTSDYQIAASWIEAVEVKDNYVIKRGTTDSISWDSYFRLQEDKSYVCMDTVPDLKKGTLLLSPGQCTDYFKEWISQNEEKPTTVMNSEVDKYWPAEAETWIPIPCVEFVIVDALQMAEIAKKWDLQKEEEQEGILLFLPEYSDVENTALKKGIGSIWVAW